MNIRRILFLLALAVLVCVPAIPANAQVTSAADPVASATAPPPELISSPTTFSSAHPVNLAPSLTPRSPAAASSGDRDSKFDLFLGYSFLSNNSAEFRAGDHGWNLDGTWFLNNHIGLMFDFSGHSGSNNSFGDDQDIDQYYFLFGPNIVQRFGNFSVSGHFGAGIAHQRFSYFGDGSFNSANENDFAMEVGGNLDWVGKGHFGLRIIKFDYLFSQIQGRTVNNLRVSTGLIIRFK
jgi:hypothetical protein